jgi:7,8-dihydro-6-hydroxymethylpterin-pyrophosphokinase
MTYQVDILNPKAEKLLKDLADLDLIKLSKANQDPFLAMVIHLRKKNANKKLLPTLEEITNEVEQVRTQIYARQNKS